jgi:fructose-1-phosphate kinase PfkB-like protein
MCACARGALRAHLLVPTPNPKTCRCIPLLRHLAFATPNAEELRAIARELRRQRPGQQPSRQQEQQQQQEQQRSSQQQQQQQHQQQQQQEQAGSAPGAGAAEQLLAALAPDAALVLAEGLGAIVLTMGEAGAALLTLEGGQVVARHVPAAPARVRSLSGAGDCLAAGFAAALAAGAPAERALAEGTLAAAAAVEAEANVPPADALAAVARGQAAVAAQLSRLRVLRFPATSAL